MKKYNALQAIKELAAEVSKLELQQNREKQRLARSNTQAIFLQPSASGRLEAESEDRQEENLLLMQAFCLYSIAGALPPAESLHFVAMCIDQYIEAQGSLTLDEAFGLRSKQRSGNPSKRYANRQKDLWLLHEIAMLRARSRLSIDDAVAKVYARQDSPPPFGPDALEKKYKREDWRSIEAMYRKIIPRSQQSRE